MTADGALLAALAAAFLLGLRHATDPDHLAAVATLVLDRTGAAERGRARSAGLLGLSWGAGHAATLFLVGLPVVLLGRAIPPTVQRGAEALVGLLIAILAARLLLRWRRGHFHAHPHRHGDLLHSHPHFHDPLPAHEGGSEAVPEHDHRHAEALGRSPAAAFGIGLVHGIGGSAAAGILIVAAAPEPYAATLALALFAGGTALSMGILSALVGGTLDRRPVAEHMQRVIPTLGVLSLTFGAWYAMSSW